MIDKVKTENGYISGIKVGEKGREIHTFYGIPYAAPPVGDLRWCPPQAAVSWTGTRACTTYGNAAPQISISGPMKPHKMDLKDFEFTQSEDCLYLNILTPAKKSSDKLPVMVWMHGGGFIYGTANEAIYNLTRLPSHGVVQVNVNMRLGPFGMCAHPLLSRESVDGVSGNYMFLDMVAALKWVQRNITAFGGDPGNVTIFGESGGGAKVVSLLASPLAKGLFNRVIAESGSPDGKNIQELESVGENFFKKLGVAGEKDPLKAARALPWKKIIDTEEDMLCELSFMTRAGLWDLAIDGWFMPQFPQEIFRAGKQNPVDYMLLANLGELTTPPGGYLIPAYLGVFSGAEKTGAKVHAIIFDKVPAGWRSQGCFSFHAVELGYVFGDWDNKSGFWKRIMSIAGLAGAKTEDPGLDAEDKNVSEMMMKMWTNYAKTGQPDIPGAVDFPTWDKNSDRYLFIGKQAEVKSGYSKLPAKR
jgi:para-nitrobenzyl esterase